jgi:hypothetical protein
MVIQHHVAISRALEYGHHARCHALVVHKQIIEFNDL